MDSRLFGQGCPGLVALGPAVPGQGFLGPAARPPDAPGLGPGGTAIFAFRLAHAV
ncbi:MAG: hypothetical protein LBL95_02260 [Deltaproteobacteria bacterium]|nr:hypothetical protein [Deltaproteobacteria bacterium]